MKKKEGGKRGEAALAPVLFEGVSARGKKVVAAGAALVVLGFIALSRVDPMGRNAFALPSCFLLLGGYAAMGAGFFLGDPPPPSSPS